MAMIKCPECGHQISDKAPVCPNCGVEIAGKIIKCPQCGEIYFKDQPMCPNCHHLTRLEGRVGNVGQAQVSPAPTSSAPRPQHPGAPTPPPVPSTGTPGGDASQQPAQKPARKSRTVLVLSLVFAILVCGVCFYFYSSAKSSKEEESFEFAMKSDDPEVLQLYLDNNADAPQDHIDAITARLQSIKQGDQDWNNALVSGTKAALMDYLTKHPTTEHRAEAMHKIDSLDWVDASNENTQESIQKYLTEHADGEYLDDATAALKLIKAKTVQPEDKALVTSVLRHFFQAVNSRNEAALQATVSPLLSSFLGRSDATKADVATFLHKIYKDDITNMNWRIGNNLQIKKNDVGDGNYEYAVTFSATQDIERTDPDKERHATYNINARINTDGLISEMNMTKILQ